MKFDMALGFLFSIVGLAVLAVAADQFVKGAARLAVLLHISPVVVGAIVIGFGTSAPEMVLSGLAAADGQLDLGVGNIIGSNVANISLVLGSAALITTIPVSALTVKRDGLTSVLAVVVFALIIQNGLSYWKGALLIGLLFSWLFLVLRGSKSKTGSVVSGDSGEKKPDHNPDHNITEFVGEDKSSGWVETLRTVLGLIFVALSAYLLVDGAERIAEAFDLTEGFVGYTLVAVGTSAPELVTAIAAARQRETDLMVGNVLGSNVFNSLAVGGLISIVGPGSILDVKLQTIGAAIMTLICMLSWCTMAANHRVTYRDSIVLLSLWLGSVYLLAID